MVLKEIGEIANNCWLEIPEHFPFVKLKNHIVMPNHVHGIVVIDKPDNGRNDNPDGRNVGPNVPMAMVETRLIASLPLEPLEPEPLEPPQPNKIPGGITGNKNPMLHDNLSKIIRWYKGRTTFESWKTNPDFAWQSRFHDHIIRNDELFHNIKIL
jgi:putative transposase